MTINNLNTIFFGCILLTQIWFNANAQPLEEKRKYTLQRLVGEEPEIDGNLDDDCWLKQGEWATNFRQFLPKNDADPTRDTEFKILYDDDNIYAAFRCFDDLDSIVVQASRRDNMNGDIIGIPFKKRTRGQREPVSIGNGSDAMWLRKCTTGNPRSFPFRR